MEAAQVLASYSLGDADNLRRAMGKKKADVMEAEKSIFVEGCKNNNISKKKPPSTLKMFLLCAFNWYRR